MAMLAIELKRTDKTDWASPLKKYAKSTFPKELASDHEDSFAKFQQQREDVRNGQDRNENALELYLRYYNTLLSIEKRFPISEEQVRVCFTWYDAYKGKKEYKYNLNFEKAGILFNIGALYSHLGLAQIRQQSVEGLKRACAYYQSAAGAFQALAEFLSMHPANATSTDLTTDSLTFLQNLMLAQAQECVHDKAVKDHMKPVILAKLALQVADYYDAASGSLGNQALKTAVDRNWPVHIEAHAAYFKATAEQHQAAVALAADSYGEQVSRLVAARMALEAVKPKLKGAPTELVNWFGQKETIVAKTHATAEKENDSIYHERVPPRDRLPAIEKKSLVKHTPPAVGPLPPGEDPFHRLVPFAVTQAASIYQERKADVYRATNRALDEQSDLLKAALNSMNLPGALDALETPVGGAAVLPPSLSEKINAVRSEGGVNLARDQITTLQELYQQDALILDQAIRVLDEEEAEDETLRSTHGSERWQRTPSHTLTANLRQEAAKFRGHLEHAVKSDAYIRKKFTDNEAGLELMSGPPERLAAMMPVPARAPLAGIDLRIVASLKTKLQRIDRMVAERAALQGELRAVYDRDDVVPALLSLHNANSEQEREQVFTAEIQKYAQIQQKLNANYGLQQQLLGELAAENATFVAARAAAAGPHDAEAARREGFLQMLGNAAKVYSELKGNLREGIQFYSNFQELLKSFQRKCDDFVFARKTEKQDLLAQLSAPQPAASPAPPGYAQPSAPAPSAPVASGGPAYGMPPGMYHPGMMPPGMMQPGMMQPGMMPPPGYALPPGYAAPGGMPPGGWQPHMAPGYQPSAPPQMFMMPPGTVAPPGVYMAPPGYNPNYKKK